MKDGIGHKMPEHCPGGAVLELQPDRGAWILAWECSVLKNESASAARDGQLAVPIWAALSARQGRAQPLAERFSRPRSEPGPGLPAAPGIRARGRGAEASLDR